MQESQRVGVRAAWAVGVVAALALAAAAQRPGRQGHSVGTVTVHGHFIVLELNPGALGRQNRFDLQGRSLRFTPGRDGYRVSDLPLQWDPNRGRKLTGPAVNLQAFAFPFSGQQWHELSVGASGSIRMGAPGPARHFGAFVLPPRGGVSVPRFAQMAQAAGALVDTQPAICALFKPRMSGTVYVKQDADHVLLTWDVTLPYGGIQDWHWRPALNQFQALLAKDGSIVLSYRRIAARDGIVGIYPRLGAAAVRPLARLRAANQTGTPPASQAGTPPAIRSVALAAVDHTELRVTFRAAAALPAPGSQQGNGLAYQVRFALPGGGAAAAWTVAAFSRPGQSLRYFAFGPGVSRQVEVRGSQVTIAGVLPAALQSAPAVMVSAAVLRGRGQSAAVIPPRRVRLRGLRDPEVHFAALAPGAGPYPVAYEAFHYYRLPNYHNLACTVIQALGDKFDFLAYYSDFRVDNQEAGTPSNGPRGHGPGGPVTGLGRLEIPPDPAAYCSAGRFQWGFIQPVSATAIQMQAYPPADAPILGPEDITHYEKQLGEISPSGRMPPYMYAMSQIGHEMGHRWGAFADAKVNGKIIALGPVHWTMGLQVRVPFPYVRPTEASIMGGGVWQDNHNGTYTQLDDNYYVPATGYSYLDLYNMGLIAPQEVPNFFLLRHLQYVGHDARGHRVFKADRLDLNIGEVIAADGPRRPDVAHSQRRFNTGMVLVEQHGHQPSALLLKEVSGIRRQWIKYFAIATGRRASMTANPR